MNEVDTPLVKLAFHNFDCTIDDKQPYLDLFPREHSAKKKGLTLKHHQQNMSMPVDLV